MAMLVYSPEEEEEFFDQIDQVYMLTEDGETEQAEELLLELESSIMDPKENCSVGAIMLDSIYAFYDQTGQIEKALPYFLNETDFLKEKLQNSKIDNPVHFITTGSIYYELEDLDKAREYFKIAYGIGKKDLFEDFHADFLFLVLAPDADFADFKENFVPFAEEEQDELTDEQQELMDEYCENGNAKMEEEQFNQAADWFKKAYDVLPEPREAWEATGYITASLGEAYLKAKKYKEAKEQLLIADSFYQTGEMENPFVMMLLGAAHMELGEEKEAVKFLSKAYEMEGAQLFEEDEAKYLQFLKKHKKLS